MGSTTQSRSIVPPSSSNSHRTSLKTPHTNNVRWPVNLNQLAAISLDDDSDLDRSFTDVSSNDLGSVKLLRMLKDSDDESTPSVAPSESRLRSVRLLSRPRSVYSSIQQPTQRSSSDLTRSSSHRKVESRDSSIPKLQQYRVSRSDPRGLSISSSSSSLQSQNGSPNRASTAESHAAAHQPSSGQAEQQPQTQQQRTSRISGTFARPAGSKIGSAGTRYSAPPSTITAPSTTATTTTTVANANPTFSNSLLQRPKALNHSSSGSSMNAHHSKSSLPAPSSSSSLASRATGSGSVTAIKQRSSIPMTRQDSLQGNTSSSSARSDSEPRGAQSPSRIPGSPRGGIPTLAAKSVGTHQTQQSLSRPTQTTPAIATDSQIGVTQPEPDDDHSFKPNDVPMDTQRVSIEEKTAAMISELTKELERCKIEARDFQEEHALAETRRKQISDLERDLEVALEALQNAEGKVLDIKTEKDQALEAQKGEHQGVVESLQSQIKTAKLELEQAAQEKEELGKAKSLCQDLEQKLSLANKEIEQLELQVVPAELQDVHQAHFQATQELEQAKIDIAKLREELSQEKSKVTREQEESGHLLVKLSQLQETISNQLRDIGQLKDQLKDHEDCKQAAEVAEYQHKKSVDQLQKEIATLQQQISQTSEQKSQIEQAYQEIHAQVQTFQQQLQLQQTQLIQQQTEIGTLRVALEVEQKQSSMLLQQQAAAAAVAVAATATTTTSATTVTSDNNVPPYNATMAPQFGRRVSNDHDVTSVSFQMADSINNAKYGGNAQLDSASSTVLGNSVPHAGMATFPQLHRSFDNGSILAQGVQGMSAALPPTSGGTYAVAPSGSMQTVLGGMGTSSSSTSSITPTATTVQQGYEVEVKPRMIHRGSSGSIGAGSRASMHGDLFGTSGSSQSVEELTAQLHSLMKEKERFQADLSKIPLTGGGPMTRRKVELLEEAMDETERAMSKIRYSLRLRS
ncbi:hypothetical protein BGZ94_006546 [Podila epigama]|nr:hypothetical protein BGZ94_006546 [Podila epigama]